MQMQARGESVGYVTFDEFLLGLETNLICFCWISELYKVD